jgi:hypothetical protein
VANRRGRGSGGGALGLLPGGAETITDSDSVITQHDRSADFSSIHTYALPDSVRDASTGPGALSIDHSHDAQILARVQANLDHLGWIRVDPASAAPDVDVLVSAAAKRYISYVSYPFYAGWPGWAGFRTFDASWGVYYPWVVPGVVDVVVFDAGSVMIDMLDARNPDPSGKQLRAVWTAAFQGLLAGTTDSLLQRIEQGIDQAFAQSPYL